MGNKKKWSIEVSQNGWEYVGHVTIIAESITLTGEKSLLADGVAIDFEEEIGTVEQTPWVDKN